VDEIREAGKYVYPSIAGTAFLFFSHGAKLGSSGAFGKTRLIEGDTINGNGCSLIQIEEPVADCSFINGLYRGDGEHSIEYLLDKNESSNIVTHSLTRLKSF
jgi:hypothetical protein